jgi:predicted nucleic acid-binding protein
MLVVADTSPLNYLVWIQQDTLLPVLYDRVVIPPAVYTYCMSRSNFFGGKQLRLL